TVVDTVGAGDGFAVGMISALLENHSFADAVQRANWIGSRAVQSRGDMEGLPTRAEMSVECEGAVRRQASLLQDCDTLAGARLAREEAPTVTEDL
ncbi:MAG: PfkB family carbohydrate kinase, partial [Pseudomonas sp.]